jgi:hypothetical protein
MDWSIVGGFVRHILTAAGGGLVANGTVTGSEWEAVVGGAVAIIGVIWSVVQKRRAKA